MILKNVQFAKTKNATVLDFGEGDIHIATAKQKDDKYTCVLFRNIKKGKIGRGVKPKPATSDDMKPEIVMIFRKTESIEVVLDALKKAKKDLKKYLK